MSTMISTQERATSLMLDRGESTGSIFSGLADAITEIGYCLKLSAQSLSFPRAESASNAAAVDSWPVDLWVF